jgi:hypothetical protein
MMASGGTRMKTVRNASEMTNGRGKYQGRGGTKECGIREDGCLLT